jgi:Domain of Unknown Function (DUF1080)
MDTHTLLKRLAFAFALLLAGCAHSPGGTGWTTLIDGAKGLENWNVLGDANWRSEDGAVVADKGSAGFLVSKTSYKDFVIHAEFWAATDTNSGIFIRAADPKKIGADNSYEVNIWDIRPDPSYGTGAIVNFAKVPVPLVHKAGGQWNTMEVTAQGSSITVKLNGVVTSTLNDNTFPSGPFALQFGPGVKNVTGGPIKWRKVMIKPLS